MPKEKTKSKSDAGKRIRTNASPTGAPTMAERADLHQLYEKAVQIPDFEVEFMGDTFKALRKRTALSLREDFCGTGLLARQWCRSQGKRTAIGVDLDRDVLAWGQAHNVTPYADELGSRLQLVHGDVTTAQTQAVDIVCAFNFSFCVFKTRAALLAYFRQAHRALGRDGLLFLDIYGGTESIVEIKEKRKVGRFTYIWQQARFNPLTHDTRCHIHFKFADGSQLRRAFTYEWRLWTVPELRELLEEAGFSQVKIFWERMQPGDDDDDDMLEGSGIFDEIDEVENQESWVCYVVGLK